MENIPWLRYTYGILPAFSSFANQYKLVLGSFEAKYAIRKDEEWGDQDFNAAELYNVLNKMTDRWSNGDDEAGNWVSSVLQTLNIEWI